MKQFQFWRDVESENMFVIFLREEKMHLGIEKISMAFTKSNVIF